MEKIREAARADVQDRTRMLVQAGALAALGCAATMVLRIPSPTGGYLNLGDAVVLLGAYLLGPAWGALAGGIGPALADLLAGYAAYVPATLVIKALMALAAALIFCAFAKNGSRFGKTFSGSLLGSVAAEIIMVVGYFLYELPLFGYAPSLESAVTTNLPQAAVGLVAGMALFTLLDRTHLAARMKGEPIHA